MTAVELLGIEGIDEIEALDIEGSAIYRARQFRHNRLVAIKILDRSQEPLMPAARFDLRRSALRRFAAGEGVVSLYGHGVTSAGHRYLIMPYFRMGSLADQLNHGPMPWHRAAELVKRTAEVVAEGHGLRLALGNLKPSSVLLADASSPLVSVYGLATRRFDDGSPSYRAPEVGRGARPAAPADVYSLALILAALIAGRPPNRGSLSREFMTDVESLAPERIVEVIERGLAPSPASRHPAADHLALALGRAIGGDEPPLASPPDPTAGDGPIDLDVLLGTQPPPPSDPPPPLIAATSPPPPPMPSADERAGLDPQANGSTIDDHQGQATEQGGTPASTDDDLPRDDDHPAPATSTDDDLPRDDDHPAPATGADDRSPMQQAGSLAVIGDTTRRLVLDVAARSDPTPDQPPPALLTDTDLGSASDQPPPPLLHPGDRPQVLQTTASADVPPLPPTAAVTGLAPPPSTTTGEEPPFRTFDRQRSGSVPANPLLRLVDPLQAAWDQLQRSLGSALALVGFAVIAGLVGTLAVRDLRGPGPGAVTDSTFSTSQDADGPSTVPSASQAPAFVEPPATHQTSTTAAAAPGTNPAGPSTVTTAPTTTAQVTSRPSTSPTTAPIATTAATATTTSRPRPPTTAPPTSPATTQAPTTERPPAENEDPPIGPPDPLIEEASVTRVRATTARVQFTSSSCVTASFTYGPPGGRTTAVSGGSRCATSFTLLLGTVTPRLAPATTYSVTISATDGNGATSTQQLWFTTLG